MQTDDIMMKGEDMFVCVCCCAVPCSVNENYRSASQTNTLVIVKKKYKTILQHAIQYRRNLEKNSSFFLPVRAAC